MTLQEYKENKGLSYRAMSLILGVGHDSLFHYVKGTRFPSFDVIIRIEEKTKGAVSVRDWKRKG